MKFPDRPWLVLGKGPSFSRRYEFRLQDYNTFALNHVVREQSVDVAHVIDIEVVEPCANALLYNCNWLIMPRRPHVHCMASDYMTLEDWIQCIPVLAEAEKRVEQAVHLHTTRYQEKRQFKIKLLAAS